MVVRVFGFIYITTNLVNNRKYIGKCEYNRINGWEEYLGSGKILRQAIKKYGRENFRREIIYEAETLGELNAAEKYYVAQYNACESSEFYNIASGGTGGNTRLGYSSEEYDAYRMRFSHPGELNGMYGRKQSDESKSKNGSKTKERFACDAEFRDRHAAAVKKAMESVDMAKLAYKNRSLNVHLVCSICGKEEMVYTSQQKYCSDCKKRYSPWELRCLDKSH